MRRIGWLLIVVVLAACGKDSDQDHPPVPTLSPTLDINQIPVLGEDTPPPPVPLEINDPRYPIQPATGTTYTTGQRLYEQNCSACHGINGEGEQPDPLAPNAAPPHNADGHTWHHADQQNFATVWYGRGIAGVMPPFYSRLSPDEIIAVLAYIKTWWEADQQAYQIGLSQQVIESFNG
jgi:mono/diheme cytochrome c family protein